MIERFAASRPVWSLATALALLSATVAEGALPGLGDVTGVEINGNVVRLSIGADKLIIQACTPQIVRIDYRRAGQNDPNTPVIDPHGAWPSGPQAAVTQSASAIEMKTPQLTLRIDKTPCRLLLLDATGRQMLWEQASGGIFVDASSGSKGGLRFYHLAGQNFYGIKAYGKDAQSQGLLRNGDNTPDRTYRLDAGTQGAAAAPLVWTTAGYGLLVDSDDGYMVVDDSRLEFYYGSPPAGPSGRRYEKPNSIQFHLFVGDAKGLLAAASQITGHAPMFPRWAMGFANSQWGIDERELYDIVDGYRARDIPLDNFTLDFDWKAWGKARGGDKFGEFRWNTEQDHFPSAEVVPPATASALKSHIDGQGVKLTGIMKPRILRNTEKDQDTITTQQANEAAQFGYWYSGLDKHRDYFSGLPVGELDFFKPDCRTWFWKHVAGHGALDGGIVGFWNDEADEADIADIPNSDQHEHAVFNSFEHFHMQQALYEGWRAHNWGTANAPRLWSINRTFYLGAQRLAYGMWSGDIGTGFDTMERQSERMLSVAALGQAKWGMDTGGFSGNPSPENYARWMQFNAFVPIFRVHGTEGKKRYPWKYGYTAEEVAKNAIQLRYRFAPYVYAYERLAYEEGVGLVRPLMIEFPTDVKSANQSKEWMFGQWLLVAPVLKQQVTQTAGQTTMHRLYLPPGTWIDFFRGTVLHGGRDIEQYSLNPGCWTDIPLFIRAGAIIASQDVVRSLGEAQPSQVYLDVFPDKSETSTLYYDDDGASYAYEKNVCAKQWIKTRDDGTSVSLTVGAKSGDYQPTVKHFLARVHGRAGTAVALNQQALPKAANLDALRLLQQGWAVGRDVYGPVTYVKIAAGSAVESGITITGNETTLPTSLCYEAEDASLSGASPSSRARASGTQPGFTGTGFVEGLDQPEAGITFSVMTQTAGVYPVSFRTANVAATPQTLSVYVNGDRWGVLDVPPQSAGGNWTDATTCMQLAAGNNIVTCRHDPRDTGNVRIDSMSIPFMPTAAIYEAETGELSGGASVNVDHRHYAGTGFVDALTAPGAGVTFSVVVAMDGDLTMQTRYANGNGADRSLSLYVNGVKQKSVAFAATGDWDTWGNETETVALHAGPNTVTLSYDPANTGHINLDRFLIVGPGAAVPPLKTNLVENGGFECGLAGWTESRTSGPYCVGADAGASLGQPEYGRFGDKRAYFHSPAPYAERIKQSVVVPDATKSYRFAAWARCANQTPTQAKVEISGTGSAAQTADLGPSDGKWRLVTIEHIPVTTGHADVVFSVTSPGGTTVQLDGVEFVEE